MPEAQPQPSGEEGPLAWMTSLTFGHPRRFTYIAPFSPLVPEVVRCDPELSPVLGSNL